MKKMQLAPKKEKGILYVRVPSEDLAYAKKQALDRGFPSLSSYITMLLRAEQGK